MGGVVARAGELDQAQIALDHDQLCHRRDPGEPEPGRGLTFVDLAGAGETVTYSQRDMSAAITTALQQYRAVAPVSGSASMLASTATDPALLTAAL